MFKTIKEFFVGKPAPVADVVAPGGAPYKVETPVVVEAAPVVVEAAPVVVEVAPVPVVEVESVAKKAPAKKPVAKKAPAPKKPRAPRAPKTK
jgi:hypothetical protein